MWRGFSLLSIVEFFKNLPRKKCHNCGKEILEKADCYGNLCDHCDHPAR
ncbi:protein YhfH [Sediminibacillus halophilus]